jgi:subfamily B ATP-binding cassette protein MsbA
MTVGALTVFLAYLAKFFQPVRDLAQMSNTLAQVSVGFERVQEISNAGKVIPEHPAATEAPPFRGEIAFEQVAFGYDPELPVLHDITLTIRPGQMVGIVGPTGSGKSTVVSLIPRFRDPDAGSILIDGMDCCAERCATTSPSAALMPPTTKSSKRPNWPTPTSSSPACPTATTAWSATAV